MLFRSDLLIVRPSLLVVEIEIKISTSDFRADAKKTWKHGVLKTGTHSYESWGNTFVVDDTRPNYFYYALPDTIFGLVEVPQYAGLLAVHKKMHSLGGYDYEITVSKKAPRLHLGKLIDRQLMQLLRSYDFKYWNNRRLLKNEELAA